LAQESIIDVSTPPQGDHWEIHMSQLVLMIAKIDQIDNPEKMSALWRQAIPAPNGSEVKLESYSNEMEAQVEEIGMSFMLRLLVEQWKLSDKLLSAC
jgi:hypothetical protein